MRWLTRGPKPLPGDHGSGGRSGSTLGGPEWLTLSAPAKLNLHLEVRGRRPDGFHELETVMTPLRLADTLSLRATGPSTEIRLHVHGPQSRAAGVPPVPTDTSNLVVRALEALRQYAGIQRGAEVLLEKRTPSQAGLGGGSSDAAAALRLGRAAWGLELDDGELAVLASRLGSDVPFFLHGGAAVCHGRGEEITRLATPAGLPCVVIKPPIGLSTAEVYASVGRADAEPHRGHSDTPVDAAAMIDALHSGDWRSVGSRLFNRLQASATRLTDEIPRVLRLLEKLPTHGALMTGSGSACFALFGSHRAARRAAGWLRSQKAGWVVATSTA